MPLLPLTAICGNNSVAKKHLVVDISSHGFGHLAQTAAVLNALPKQLDLRLTLRSMAPLHVLKERIQRPFELIRHQQDKGMVMKNALEVDSEATLCWYQDFHADYPVACLQAQQQLEALQPDLLFSNVPYLSLEAAARLNLPSIALCSLNWGDIFQAYCGHLPGAQAIHTQIHQAYERATLFLQATPSLPMKDLHNTYAIAPIALKGQAQKIHLQHTINANQTRRFILVALGGIGMNYPLKDWPTLKDTYWIFPDQALHRQRTDFVPQSCFKLSYVDLLASCDLVLTKTGYGTQTEAVIHQKPSVCVSRGDWPEEPYLFNWHKQHGEVSFITWSDILSGRFITRIESMLQRNWRKATVNANGAEQAAEIIQYYLKYPHAPALATRNMLP